jgi:hypothetical protein
MEEKEPEKFGPNGKISASIFSDVISILNHMKKMPDELEKIEQIVENYENIFDEIASSIKKNNSEN